MSDKAQRPRVFVDFHNSDRLGRVRLNTVGTIQDLNQLGFVLREGAELVVYSYETEADAVATRSTEEGLWVASIDWNKMRDLSSDR